MDISDWRKKIDSIDARIVSLIERRAKAVKEIGKIKKKKGFSVYNKAREIEVMKNAVKKSKGVLPKKEITAIYRKIISACRSLEAKIK